MSMTAEEFKRARERLALTQGQLARILDTDARTVRKWEAPETASTARGPNPVACQVLRWMLAPGRPPEWPEA